ncbi:MAG: DUF3880 domain-containing protein [Lachnospiraceae bacterium]|nr:DUF3880 domain-containing protein [Lachnospiraceae bacterium]
MKIFYMDWACYAGEDIVRAFSGLRDGKGAAVELVRYPFENTEKRTDPAFEERFLADLTREEPDAVFSFNFYPLISLVCGRAEKPYIAFVYDSPHIAMYSYTILNPCNHVYVFDSAVAETFARQGIGTVHYLPLAADVRRLDEVRADTAAHRRYDADVAFVGSLYTEEHTFYDRMEPKLDEYTRGYLQAVMDAQLQVDGLNFVEECLRPPIVEKMLAAYPMEPNPDGVETSAWMYAQYMLNRKITQTERTLLIRRIGERFGAERTVALYTRDASFSLPGVTNRGRIDYYREMPLAFKCAKINLNLSLRSIERGMPLRALDIMGAGGFLLTNYQQDFLDFFVPGEDFVYYENDEDLLNKIEYYLTHEEERAAIAASAHDKMAADHTWESRLVLILEDVFGEDAVTMSEMRMEEG